MNRLSNSVALNSPERLALLMEGVIFTYLAYMAEQGLFGRGQESLARQFHCFAYVVRETMDRIDAGLESLDSIRGKIIALRLHREALLSTTKPSRSSHSGPDAPAISGRTNPAATRLHRTASHAPRARLAATCPQHPALFSKAALAPSLGTT